MCWRWCLVEIIAISGVLAQLSWSDDAIFSNSHGFRSLSHVAYRGKSDAPTRRVALCGPSDVVCSVAMTEAYVVTENLMN